MELNSLVENIVKILDKKKAEDIKVIETAELTIVSDYFVIASGTSSTHAKSLAEDLEYELGELGVAVGHIEGRATGWTLLDYGAVIVHVFERKSREYYNLERLWADASMLDISKWLTQ